MVFDVFVPEMDSGSVSVIHLPATICAVRMQQELAEAVQGSQGKVLGSFLSIPESGKTRLSSGGSPSTSAVLAIGKDIKLVATDLAAATDNNPDRRKWYW